MSFVVAWPIEERIYISADGKALSEIDDGRQRTIPMKKIYKTGQSTAFFVTGTLPIGFEDYLQEIAETLLGNEDVKTLKNKIVTYMKNRQNSHPKESYTIAVLGSVNKKVILYKIKVRFNQPVTVASSDLTNLYYTQGGGYDDDTSYAMRSKSHVLASELAQSVDDSSNITHRFIDEMIQYYPQILDYPIQNESIIINQ